MANNKVAYGIAKGLGIDTANMSPKEVWEAIAKKQGVSVEQAQKQAEKSESKDSRKANVTRLQELSKPKKGKDKAKFFGVEYKSVKGAEAIEKLLQEKQGHVKNAFERKEVGGIDLVWGDKDGGLLHTIMKRDRLLEQGKGNVKGIDMVRKIPEIIEKGTFDIDEKDRPYIQFDNYKVSLRTKYDGEKINWIVTAMEILE